MLRYEQAYLSLCPSLPFVLHCDRQAAQEVLSEEVISREALLDALEATAAVPRHEADTLARKLLDGQTINVSAHGQNLRLYGEAS